jgi:hypothetical protein
MKYFICIISILLSVQLKSQDLIIKNDKTEIKSKVVEISDASIKYKRWDNQNGPNYSISPAEVFMIIYANGIREIVKSKVSEEKVDYENKRKDSLVVANSNATIKSNISVNKSSDIGGSSVNALVNTKTTNNVFQGSNRELISSKKNIDSSNIFNAPRRLVYWAVPVVTQIGAQVERRLGKNNLNLGMSFDAGFSSISDVSTVTTSIGLYLSPYISINQLGINKIKQDQGLFVFARVGGVLNSATISSSVYDESNYNFGFLLGFGADYFFNNRFGITSSFVKIGSGDFALQLGIALKGKKKSK